MYTIAGANCDIQIVAILSLLALKQLLMYFTIFSFISIVKWSFLKT